MVNFNNIKTYNISNRMNKFSINDMIDPVSLSKFEDENLIIISDKIKFAKNNNKNIIVMLGGAVIKDGCSLILIELMKKGFITHLAMNGSVSIHDFEISLIGETSEEIKDTIKDGSFGMANEPGLIMNHAINKGYSDKIGYGESIAKEIYKNKYRDYSIIHQANHFKIPTTVHIAIGGDIIHQHPECHGEALGYTSFEDFKIFTNTLCNLDNAVILNLGSAVIMPEVFLKGLTIARNLGYCYENFTTANFDFLDMYRARTRVLEIPESLGAKTFNICGRHNETILKLYNLLENNHD